MNSVPSDIEIAQAASKLHINEVAAKIGLKADDIIPYGHDKAKISYDFLDSLDDRSDGKLILVTAISPTPAGEGKTTTAINMAAGLSLEDYEVSSIDADRQITRHGNILGSSTPCSTNPSYPRWIL